MVVSSTVIQVGSRPLHAERGSGSTNRLISGLLAVFFLLASLVTIYEVTKIPRASFDVAHTSTSIQTIHAFYAALNEFMETGDASAVSQTLTPDALAFVPEQGAMGADSGLLTYLLALRSTVPQRRFTVERIDAGGDIAIASVRVSGATGPPPSAWPQASGTSQEFFRVRDGRIVQHWTTAPGSVLLHSLTTPPMHIELVQPGHLAIAELSFSPSQHDPQPIDGPALVIIQRGRLTLTGDGSSLILDIKTGATTVPGQHERVSVGPGQAISIPEYRAFVRNGEAEVADVRLVTLVDDPRQILETVPGVRRPPPPAINDAALIGAQSATTYGAVTVRPLAFDDRSIPTGTWELEIAWAMLGPGASLPMPADGEWAVAHVISGPGDSPSQGRHGAGTLNLLTNDGDKPVAALTIRLRAAP